MKKDTFWFSHDYNASMDEKIVNLLSKHGMTGYGVYWRIVECLYNNNNVLNIEYDRIAYELRVSDSNIVKSIINDFDLFVCNNGSFGSASIEKRLDERSEISERARKKAYKRWNKDAVVSKNDAVVSKSDAIKDIKDIKETIKEKIAENERLRDELFNTEKYGNND